jgi:hypothetical protein
MTIGRRAFARGHADAAHDAAALLRRGRFNAWMVQRTNGSTRRRLPSRHRLPEYVRTSPLHGPRPPYAPEDAERLVEVIQPALDEREGALEGGARLAVGVGHFELAEAPDAVDAPRSAGTAASTSRWWPASMTRTSSKRRASSGVSWRARWPERPSPRSATAIGSASFPTSAAIPADSTIAPGFRACSRARRSASAMGLRQMLPTQTVSTRSNMVGRAGISNECDVPARLRGGTTTRAPGRARCCAPHRPHGHPSRRDGSF